MKKILTLAVIFALSTSVTMAANKYGKAIKNSFKQDVQTIKESVKKDVDNSVKAKTEAQTAASAAKKAEKIKQIDAKLTKLNKELDSVKADKNITETERTIKTNAIQRQINFYTKQKEALK